MSDDPERFRSALHRAVDETQAAVTELRALANGLHPAVLNDGDLAAALDDLADDGLESVTGDDPAQRGARSTIPG